MSRFTIGLTLIAALSTSALARRVVEPQPGPAPMHFAQPPDNDVAEMPMRRVDRAAVRAKLAKVRAANVARFRVYQRKGVFPNNTFTDGKLNVWRDQAGHFCAAATIIKLSGNADLVVRTADQNNFIRLADVTSGPLMDWILTSGLTQDEIAAIQEPMMPVTVDPIMEPQPLDPIVVDARMRRIENRRLIAKYKQVDAQIAKNKNASLDAATDRLMANRSLAMTFLDS